MLLCWGGIKEQCCEKSMMLKWYVSNKSMHYISGFHNWECDNGLTLWQATTWQHTVFCNKNTTTEKSFLCSKCNVTVYSKHCFIGHKLFCYGNKMSFGWKCNQCNVFTYKGSNSVTNHICGQLKTCKFIVNRYSSEYLGAT